MDIFDIINLNFISLGAIIAASFTFTVSFYLFSIKNRSKATLNLALSFFFISLLSVAYVFAFTIYHPAGAYHRWLSVWAVLPGVLYMSQFFFYFPEERAVKTAQWLHRIQWGIILIIAVFWPIYTYSNQNINFQHDGLYWDFNEPAVSSMIAIVIFIYILLITGAGIWRTIVTKGKDKSAVIAITISLTITAFLPGLGNLLIRLGIWDREFYHIMYDLCTVTGWFITAIFYLNFTRDKTSFIAKISGISLATFTIVFIFISYFTINDRVEGYDSNHRNKITRIIIDKTYRPGELEYLILHPLNRKESRILYSQKDISVKFSRDTITKKRAVAADNLLQKHYITYRYFHSEDNIVYEGGFSLLSYKKFIHDGAIKLFLTFFAVITIILVGYRFFFSGTVINPLKALIEGLTKVKEGNLDITIPVKVEDEFGFLTRSYNNMVNSIKRTSIERDVAERALRSAEAKFRGLIEQSLSGIYIVQDMKIHYANPTFSEIFGYTNDEILNLSSILDIVADEDRGTVTDNIRMRINREVDTQRYTFKGKKKDGTIINIEVHGSRMRLNDRPAVIGTLIDITDRKRTEEELVEEKERLSVTLNSIGDGVIATDTESHIQLMNTTAEELTGWSFSEARGKNFKDVFSLLDKKTRTTMTCPVDDILKNDAESRCYDMQLENPILVARNGTERIVSTCVSPIIGNNNTLFGVVVAFNDITEEVFAREQLVRMRSFLKNIINSMPSILVSVDREGMVLHWNLEAEKATNITEENAIGKSLVECYPLMGEQKEWITRAIEERQLQKIEKYMVFRNNEAYYSDIIVYPLIANGVEGAVIRIDDITERVRLQEMMVQTEKMLTVGGLAAGMAHEINNPLGAILMSAQNIIRRLSPKFGKNIEAARECNISLDDINLYMENRGLLKMLEAILEMGDRASKIVSNMLTFSRRSETIKGRSDINSIIDKAIDLACHDYDLKKKYDFRHIRINRQYETDKTKIECSETEIEQVLLNIFKNSAQAMADKEFKDEDPEIIISVMDENNMLKIEISDNGPGMDKDITSHIFEPFYTTKEAGVGTGLGLSVSYHIIVHNHKGMMKAASIPGKGATFTIFLPIDETTKE